ncbi:dihydropteroate synthase [candidate division WOR-3 bacterium]|nr:dihydropteroate synthase [candidate division WOR-3 bacterium]
MKIELLSSLDFEKAKREIREIGPDDCVDDVLTAKTLYLNIKIKGLSAPACNILKQTAISFGADACIPREAVVGKGKNLSLILSGNLREIEKISESLKEQTFGLSNLSKKLKVIVRYSFQTPSPIKLKYKTIDFSSPKICGILNLTPDSFYDGGIYLEKDKAVERIYQMIEEGADMIDIGGESTRPGASPVSLKEELKRVLPVIESLNVDIPLSIDTYKSKVARECLMAGCQIVNDITGLTFDKEMKSVIRNADAACVIMHMKGTPRDMQVSPYYDDCVSEIIEWLSQRVDEVRNFGIEKIMVDPGIGFGKRNPQDNLEIIRRLREFKQLGLPIFIGVSRKSFIGKVLDSEKDERLEGGLAASIIAYLNGANIIRTHDVKESKQALSMVDSIKRGSPMTDPHDII